MTTNTVSRAMSAQQLAQIIFNKEPITILDVRNEDAYADWRIEGEQVTSINIPYFNLLDGVESVLDRIAPEQKTIVVCAQEGSARFVAEQLVHAGRTDISYLEDGMKAWSEVLVPVKIGELSGGAIYQFVRVGKGCLSYMIVSDGEAAVVDPTRMTDEFVTFAKQQGAQIKHVLDTHIHADHISGGRRIAAETGATYWLPERDAGEVTYDYTKLEETKVIKVGRTEIDIQPLFTPGHTIGSTSFIVDEQYLLTGDTLFIASIGRPDLAGKAEEWVGDLYATLFERYKELPAELIVLPAHYGKVSELGHDGRVAGKLGDLYKQNLGLHVTDHEHFKTMVCDDLPPQPNAYQEIRLANMGLLNPNDDEQQEMEIGPNRCAVHDE